MKTKDITVEPNWDVFWRLVERAGLDACWPWKGYRNKDGYGVVHITRRHYLSARLAYFWANGPIPEGRLVLHSCDNPPCCNPAHLRVGTQTENVRDTVERKRTRKGQHQRPQRGSEHGGAKLTEADVFVIRARIAAGEQQRTIAADYPVSYKMVNRIARGKAWSHL